MSLYILGTILTFLLGKNLYSRFQKNSPSDRENNFQRKEFKQEVQTDSTEQQPDNEEVQTDSTEQQPDNEEVQTDRTEQQPDNEEVQTDSTEQQPDNEDENNNK